jgi:hypothetical protein
MHAAELVANTPPRFDRGMELVDECGRLMAEGMGFEPTIRVKP